MARSKAKPKVKAKAKVKEKPNRKAHNGIIEKAVIVKASTKK